jgi:hypothetical protein
MRASAALCLAFAAAAAGCGGSPGGSAGAAEVARAYVEDYNRRDGDAMCAAFTDELRDWFERLPWFPRDASCAKIAPAAIGYGEESDTPTFERLEILSVRPHVSGRSARVEVEARYRYDAYPKPLAQVFTDEIHLLERGGRWEVAKPGGVYFLTRSAYSPPASMLDPPIADAEAHEPAPQPHASFACGGRTVEVVHDAAGDAPAPLDLRRASASVNDDGSVCLRFAFAEPPRPGTALELEVSQPVPGSHGTIALSDLSVRIGSRGRIYLSLARNPQAEASRRFGAGWDDGQLELLWRHPRYPVDGARSVRLGGETKTLQVWEPLVRDPMLGTGDEPWEGQGDRLGTT